MAIKIFCCFLRKVQNTELIREKDFQILNQIHMKFDIENIKKINIVDYLQSKGIAPVGTEGNKVVYNLRNERTPSVKVYTDANTFYDFGNKTGGSIIDLVKYLNGCNEYDAMKELTEFMSCGYTPNSFSLIRSNPNKEETSQPAMTILKVKNLENKALIQYLESRKINIGIAKKYCREVYVRMNKSGNTLFYVGFQSNDNGYVLRNGLGEFGKICTSQDITIIKGSEGKEVNVFEGFMDFLSYLSKYKVSTLKNDFIILNTVGNVGKAIIVLHNYPRINCFLDNDIAGQKALETLKTQFVGKIKDYSYLYEGFNDLNEFAIKKS